MAKNSQYERVDDNCRPSWGPQRKHRSRGAKLEYRHTTYEVLPINIEAPSVGELEEWYGKAHVVANIHKAEASPELVEEFKSLADHWRLETAGLSSLIKRVTHPAYQQIIGMGPDAIPLILKELQRAPGHWFWALEALTRGKVIVGQDAKTLTDLAKSWIDWGKRESLI